MTKNEYDRVSSEFLEDWDVARRLAEARKLLSEQFPSQLGDDGMDDLERALEGTSFWTIDQQKPPPGGQ
jgi:hypothetical protein